MNIMKRKNKSVQRVRINPKSNETDSPLLLEKGKSL
jgi:hypothetical protein